MLKSFGDDANVGTEANGFSAIVIGAYQLAAVAKLSGGGTVDRFEAGLMAAAGADFAVGGFDATIGAGDAPARDAFRRPAQQNVSGGALFKVEFFVLAVECLPVENVPEAAILRGEKLVGFTSGGAGLL